MDLAQRSLARRTVKLVALFVTLAAAIAAATVVWLFAVGLAFFTVAGPSMEPTLNNGDSIVLKQQDELQDGSLVFFYKPDSWISDSFDSHSVLVKRVVASEGDALYFDGKSFFVNGKPVLKDTKVHKTYECVGGEVGYKHTLSATEIFVAGDNGPVSLDSRRMFCDGSKDFYASTNSVIDKGTLLLKF